MLLWQMRQAQRGLQRAVSCAIIPFSSGEQGFYVCDNVGAASSMVEHLTLNQLVLGSSPRRLTSTIWAW